MDGMEYIKMATEKINESVEKTNLLGTEMILTFDTMAQIYADKEKLLLEKMEAAEVRHVEEKANMRKHYQRIILAQALTLLLVLGSIIGGILYAVSNYNFDFIPSYSQDVSSEGGGDATIEDGIHINDNTDDHPVE